ncbi:MAG: MFS transporter [Candidatus Paracaedibacteraceae bacterium]|nr:MFS transporter [Candidatus Paracaedibacteraceae bacterium]
MTLLYKRGLIVWFVAVSYYLYQYLIRVSPSVMVDDLMFAFTLDAKWLGYLVATTTFFYALVQVPIGVLSDLFGARKLILYSLVACVLGVGAISMTDSLLVAFAGRALIGVGSAAGFICVSKIASDWFPVSQKATWFALTILMGTAGAILGYAPLAKLTDAVGWRSALWYLTLLGGIVLIVNIFFLRDKEVERVRVVSRSEVIQQIKDVLKSRFAWMYAITALGMYLPISVFADLWGVPFLTLKYDLAKDVAATILSWAYVGTCGGVIFVALVSNLLKGVRLVIGAAAALVTTLISVIVFAPELSQTTLSVLLVSLGVAVGAEILCFSKTCQENDVRVAATVTGFLNFIVTLGAAFVQQFVGWLIKIMWDGQMADNGLPQYRVEDYQNAMIVVIFISLTSFVLAFFLPDKNPDYLPQESR